MNPQEFFRSHKFSSPFMQSRSLRYVQTVDLPLKPFPSQPYYSFAPGSTQPIQPQSHPSPMPSKRSPNTEGTKSNQSTKPKKQHNSLESPTPLRHPEKFCTIESLKKFNSTKESKSSNPNKKFHVFAPR